MLQLLLSPVLLWDSFLATSLSVLLYAGSLGYYHYMTFLGYGTLPFLEHTEVRVVNPTMITEFGRSRHDKCVFWMHQLVWKMPPSNCAGVPLAHRSNLPVGALRHSLQLQPRTVHVGHLLPRLKDRVRCTELRTASEAESSCILAVANKIRVEG